VGARADAESLGIGRFIALFGVAVLNGVVMITAVNHLRAEGRGLRDAVLAGRGRAQAGADDGARRRARIRPMAISHAPAPRSSGPWPPSSSAAS